MKKIILSIMIVLMSITIQVSAKDLGSFNAGDSIDQKQEVDATNFTAGNNVKVSSRINGANFVAGNNISLSSSQDILFTAGNVINAESITTKDAFLAGSRIDIKNSSIRDLYAAAEIINIDSDINRNIYAGGDTITINSRINGDVRLAADKINIGENAVITGKLIYPEEANLSIASGALVEQKESYKSSSTNTEVTLVDKAKTYIITYLSMLVTGCIIIACNQKVLKKINKEKLDVETVAKTMGVGFLSLVVTPIAAIITMITVIGIPISIISLILYGILIYLSIIPTAYYFGTKLLKDNIENKYLIFAISLLVIYILKELPMIGWLIGLLSLCFGLGIDFKLMKDYVTNKK